VEFAIAGKSAVMPAIRRLSDVPYHWDVIEAPLSEVANREKLLPADFISADGFGITETARRYLAPLKQRSVSSAEHTNWQELAANRRAVREYLDTLDQAAWGAASEAAPKFIS